MVSIKIEGHGKAVCGPRLSITRLRWFGGARGVGTVFESDYYLEFGDPLSENGLGEDKHMTNRVIDISKVRLSRYVWIRTS